VTIRALLLLGGISLALASAASAQSAGPPPSVSPPDTIASPPPASVPAAQPGLPPQRISAMVRGHGFNPIGRPVRHGNLYVQRALDPDDMEYRLVIDSITGRTVSVKPMGMAGPYAYGPGPYPYRPARFFGAPPPDDYGFGYGAPRPPRAVPSARLAPPQGQPAQQQPQQRSQPSTTAQAPLPRPKPYVAEATGSIPVDTPKPLVAQKTPDPERTPEPAKAAPPAGGSAALPPVVPLD
jgi:hypothetical protein